MQVRSSINNLNPAKANVIDPTKENFTQPLTIKKILDDLKISNDYYKVFPILKGEGLVLHLKRQPNSCFVNKFLMLV